MTKLRPDLNIPAMRSTSVGWDLCLYGNCPRGKSFVGAMCVNLSFISGRATFARYRELLRIFMTMNGNDAARRVLHFTFMDRRVKCDSRQRQSLNFKSGCKTKLFEADQKVPKPPLPNDSKFIRKIMFTTSLRSQENFPRTKDVCVFARNKRKEFS